MKNMRLLFIISTILCVASLSGCGKKEDESRTEPNVDTESNTPVPTEGTNESPEEDNAVTSNAKGALAKDVLALWEAGRKDEAVTQFLSIQWDEPSVFHQMQVLTMSEHEFKSLPQNEMKQIVTETMDLTGKLRKLMFYVVAEGEKLAASGDTNAAKEHFMAVQRYGKALSQPEHLEVIQMHGKAAMGYAEKKLSGIK